MRGMKKYFLGALLISLAATTGCSNSASKNFDLVVFHTNDRHSHFLGLPNGDYDPSNTGDGTIGGAARWMQIVEDERAANPEVLLLSAGDFTMGTMLVAANDNTADLDFMKDYGYDAACLGNHEFDWGPARLAEMIEAASLPTIPLLATNIRFNPDDPADDSLEALYGQPGEAGKYIHPYIVHTTPGGTKIGMLGLLGLDAYDVSNAKPLIGSGSMDELAQTAQVTVDLLRDEEKVDMVIALAHMGIHMEQGTATYETIELAEKTEGIDLILSGHSHTFMDEIVAVPSQVANDWTTYTMECGCYGKMLCRYDVSFEDGTRTFDAQAIDVANDLPSLEELNTYIETLEDDIEENFLPSYPLLPLAEAFLSGEFFQVLTHSAFDLPRRNNEPSNLGNLVADAMREASGAQMAFASNGGDLRESLPVTRGDEINLQDAFIVTPLGTGPDKMLGYPLAKFYTSLSQIHLILETTVCDLGLANNDYMIQMSGLRVVVDNSLAGTYNCVQKIVLYEEMDESDAGTLLFDKQDGGFQVDKDNLYEVCTSSYIADKMSGLGVFPLDAEGNKISFIDAIVKDGENREIKLWYSFALKLAAMDPISDQYNPDELMNTVGPYWRRVWDLDGHPCEGHPFCE